MRAKQLAEIDLTVRHLLVGLRKSRGITQEAVAKQLEITRSRVAYFETAPNPRVTVQYLMAYCGLCERDPAAVLRAADIFVRRQYD